MLTADIADAIVAAPGPIVVLTGAGISAESGIPTFRGPEGYWRVGSRHYQPTEMATIEAFARMPEEVWRWYLHRRRVCRGAAPNAAHVALVELERRLGDRFLLVTQNVDGLHLRAGNTRARTYEIHGNIDFCRCASGCAPLVRPMPAAVEDAATGEATGAPADPTTDAAGTSAAPLSAAVRAALRCACGTWLRPHVLWFDESYDEPLFRYVSSLRAAETAAALVVIGTSGATTLPTRVCETVASRGAPLIVVDPETTPFVTLAESSRRGLVLRGTASAIVPALAAELAALVRPTV